MHRPTEPVWDDKLQQVCFFDCEGNIQTFGVNEIDAYSFAFKEIAKYIDHLKSQTNNFVWLDISNNEFSDTWDMEEMIRINTTLEDLYTEADQNSTWKLIEYKCHTDNNFKFCNSMVGK